MRSKCQILVALGDCAVFGGVPAMRRETSYDFIFDEPGTYTFEVQAIDRDLNYSEPASVKLEVIPDPRNHRIIQLEAHIREQEFVITSYSIHYTKLYEANVILAGSEMNGHTKF